MSNLRQPTRAASRWHRAKSSRIRQLESLESRVLLTTVTGFTPPNFLSDAGTYDKNGNLWFENLVDGSIDKVVAGSVVQSIDTSSVVDIFEDSVTPQGLVADKVNNLLYFIDVNYIGTGYATGQTGAIVQVDPQTAAVTAFPLPGGDPQGYINNPLQITVANDGSVWFNAQGTFVDDQTVDSVIGRLDPSTGNYSFASFSGIALSTSYSDAAPSLFDAGAGAISAVGASAPASVWIGLSPINGLGDQAHIGAATWDAVNQQIAITNVYNINSSDPTAKFGFLTDMTTDTSGGVWFTLANSVGTDDRGLITPPADRIIHGVVSGGNLVQTEYLVPGGDQAPTSVLQMHSLSFDGQGNLWFAEENANAVGYLNTTSGNFAPVFNLPPNTGPVAVVGNPAAPEVWVANEGSGDALDQITLGSSFSGVGSNLTGVENTSLGTNVTVATFSAAPGTYNAVITWGDSTQTTVQVTSATGNFVVQVSGKTYASQGSYTGLVTVNTTGNVTVGTIGFTATISDTPLNVSSQSVTPILGRIVLSTTNFSDDANSTAAWFTATIHWGDNTTSTGLIVRTSAGHYIILALHVYSKKGTYSVTTSVTTTEANASILHSSITSSVTVH